MSNGLHKKFLDTVATLKHVCTKHGYGAQYRSVHPPLSHTQPGTQPNLLQSCQAEDETHVVHEEGRHLESSKTGKIQPEALALLTQLMHTQVFRHRIEVLPEI